MPVSMRRVVVSVLTSAVVAPSAACASDSLSERDARTAEVGRAVPASYTAALRGTESRVMLPSGRVDLTLTGPSREIAAQDTADAVPYRPAGSAVAVGVAWSLNRGGFADVDNRQLTSPETIFGRPQPVRLWLVTDGTRREIKNVQTLENSGDRLRNATWLIVPSGVRRWTFEIDYAGVVQRVDARTGRVTSGRAATLYRPLPRDVTDSCELDTDDYTSCSLAYAVGYPYVDGAGWAPAGKVFALVSYRVDSDIDAAADTTVGGSRLAGRVSDGPSTYFAYPVTPASSYAVRGRVTADESGRTTTFRMTGTLAVPVTP